MIHTVASILIRELDACACGLERYSIISLIMVFGITNLKTLLLIWVFCASEILGVLKL